MENISFTEELVLESLRYNRFQVAWNYLKAANKSMNPSPKKYLAALIFKFQGNYKSALELLQSVESAQIKDGVLKLKWKILLVQLQAFSQLKVQQSIDLFEEMVERAEVKQFPRLYGQIFDQLGRIYVFGVKIGLLKAGKMKMAEAYWAKAISLFEKGQYQYEALIVKLQLLRHLLSKEKLDATTIFSIESSIERELQALNYRNIKAEYELLKLTHGSLDVSGFNKIPPSYWSVIEYFRSVNDRLGVGKTFILLGQKFQQAGSDGSLFTQKGIDCFSQIEAYSYLNDGWNKRALEYLVSGDLNKSLITYRKSLQITKIAGLPVARLVTLMGIGECLSRKGESSKGIDFYRQAESLAVEYGLLNLVGLNLANIYERINQKDRAIAMADASLDALLQSGSSKNVSLAFFINGNIRSGAADWEGALKVWEKGLYWDKEHQFYQGLSEKYSSMAWGKAQYYFQLRKTISEKELEMIDYYFEKAQEFIPFIPSKQIQITQELQIYQLKADIFIRTKRYEQALSNLEHIIQHYEQNNMMMQAANSRIMAGLIGYKIGNIKKISHWISSIEYFNSALIYFEQMKMLDFTWRIKYYMANLSVALAEQHYSSVEKQNNFNLANQLLQLSSNDIDHLRQTFSNVNPLESDAGKLGLVADKGKVYELAINLNLINILNAPLAYYWIEKQKARALVDLLDEQLDKEAETILLTESSKQVDNDTSSNEWKRIQSYLT